MFLVAFDADEHFGGFCIAVGLFERALKVGTFDDGLEAAVLASKCVKVLLLECRLVLY